MAARMNPTKANHLRRFGDMMPSAVATIILTWGRRHEFHQVDSAMTPVNVLLSGRPALNLVAVSIRESRASQPLQNRQLAAVAHRWCSKLAESSLLIHRCDVLCCSRRIKMGVGQLPNPFGGEQAKISHKPRITRSTNKPQALVLGTPERDVKSSEATDTFPRFPGLAVGFAIMHYSTHDIIEMCVQLTAYGGA
ncbi:hypothetical protein LX32DRAFT_68970 [Colletotrichum zoysiae]|uniref:Uncharacterized protein n=1 Tax=Colletotrichum zoysiae TaxID=1216348 RepID=A0AAD9H9X3_9PEZI|nr:hypothetical protein LX32DRAFT_68970 [Colletotrichum zoysiae]